MRQHLILLVVASLECTQRDTISLDHMLHPVVQYFAVHWYYKGFSYSEFTISGLTGGSPVV